MPQFDPSIFPSLIFWLLVSFGLLYGVINFWVLPKFQRTLAEREQREQKWLEEARQFTEEAKQLETEIATKQAQLDEQIESMRSQSAAQIQAESQAVVEAFEQELLAMETEQQASLKALAEEFRADYKDELAKLVGALYSKFSTASPAQAKLDSLIDQVGKQGHNMEALKASKTSAKTSPSEKA